MKRELFDFLNTDLQFIRGVGPVLAARFADLLGGRRILDFMLHIPAYVKDRGIIDSVSAATPGEVITIMLQVKSHKLGQTFGRRRRPTRIICADKTGKQVVIQFFNTNFLDYWVKKFPIGEWRLVSGKLEPGATPTINHPEFVEEPKDADKIPKIQAIYPSGEGITQKTFTNVRDQIFADFDNKLIGEDEHIVEFFDALKHAHFAKTSTDLLPMADDIVKLSYFELFAHQMAIAISRRTRNDERHRRTVRQKKYDLLDKFYASLPFDLTGAQKRAIDEIHVDMLRNFPMMRLVQGDVGCGKTMVAMAAMVIMAEFGAQTALLAPTDTLAGQHYAKLKPLCDRLGLVCDILTGRDKGAARREKLTSLRSGRTRLVVGTHALFSEDVIYKDLGLVIIDEQHRFGVGQRESLRAKGNNPDVLALSATPIPRTLSMTIYGDMDISIINEKPAGRIPIKTTKLPISRISALIEHLKPQIVAGAKVFWVCPLVTDSEESDATAAEYRYNELKQNFTCVGLVHGQMPKSERDAVMAQFADKNSDIKILVATTVIEVGIDVPDATIIVIENAERFGLAALHQLRGRVGRGGAQSFCILLHGNNLSPDGLKRLDILTETDDGFVIAEQDLMMRGVGELLGTRQTGWINYHFVAYREHRDLFKLASRAAVNMVTVEPWARDLMYIFDRTTILGA
ncbi:MAG: ATP-dependent DNA helicase RecG [Alphaproteobacteria bacterium]|nr:ATP-dependent DNA helicase RecG [Alphaproteobacteria bacterium]